MIKVVLVCVAGLSTSILKRNMQLAAENYSENIEIDAMSANDLELIEAVDVLLIGPQIEHLYLKIKEQFTIPVLLIHDDDYSSLNGENVLKMTLKYVNQHSDTKNEICIIDMQSSYTTLLIEHMQTCALTYEQNLVITGIEEKDFPVYRKAKLYLIEPRLAYKLSAFQKQTDTPIMPIEYLDFSMLNVEKILNDVITLLSNDEMKRK